MIIEAVGGNLHGARNVAEQRIIGPQRAADEPHAAKRDDVVFKQVDAIERRGLPRRRQFAGKVATVVFVIAHHHHDRQLHRHDLAQACKAILGALADVSRDDDRIDLRRDRGRPRRATSA